MINRINEISPRKVSFIAGLLYLVIIVSGIFAEFFVRTGLIVSGETAVTVNNISVSLGLFRLGIASDIIMILSDVAIALIFYHLLKPVNKSLAMLAAFFRLIQAAILGANLLSLFKVVQIVKGTAYLSDFSSNQLNSLVMMYLDSHADGYSLALIFFGFSILILGYLIFKSGYIPEILGIFLIIAALGYLTDSFANFLMSDYESYKDIFQMIVFIPAFIGELSLCLWLLFRGIKLNDLTET